MDKHILHNQVLFLKLVFDSERNSISVKDEEITWKWLDEIKKSAMLPKQRKSLKQMFENLDKLNEISLLSSKIENNDDRRAATRYIRKIKGLIWNDKNKYTVLVIKSQRFQE